MRPAASRDTRSRSKSTNGSSSAALSVRAWFFILALWLQDGQGFSPLQTGVTLIAFAAGGFVAGGLAIALATRLGRVVLSAGALLMAGGSFGLLLASHSTIHGLDPWQLVPAL